MRPIHTLIDTKYLTKAQFITSLTTSVRSRLSSELREYCWVVDIIGNSLVIVTDSPEHATVLRYQQHELLKQINEEFTSTLSIPVRRTKIKVDYKLAQFSIQPKSSINSNRENREVGIKNCTKILSILNKP